eukprot:55456_1
MSTNYPIKFTINKDTRSKTIYLDNCTYDELLKAAIEQLTSDQIKHNTIEIKDQDEFTIKDDDDLETAFDEILDSDNSNTEIQPLFLNIILTKKQVTQEVNVNIERSNIFEYFIEPNSIKNDSVEITLSLYKPVIRTQNFYIYECGREDNDCAAQYSFKKGQDREIEELDLDEINNKKSFKIALYQNEHDTQSISN